jgi:uracil phosphoribosyltransferase
MYSNIEVITIDHPLLRQKLSFARDRDTGYVWFRDLVEEMSRILAVYALSSLTTETAHKENNKSKEFQIVPNNVIFVAQMRSGLHMLRAFQDIYPIAQIGYVGSDQDIEKKEVYRYHVTLPEKSENSEYTINTDVFLIEPAIGKGLRTSVAIDSLIDAGFLNEKIRIVTLHTNSDGLLFLDSNEKYRHIRIYTASEYEFTGDGFSDFSRGSIGTRLCGGDF